MTQRSVGACQITLGSRLPGASWAITGLPSYFCQVAPPSALNARHWVNSSGVLPAAVYSSTIGGWEPVPRPEVLSRSTTAQPVNMVPSSSG